MAKVKVMGQRLGTMLTGSQAVSPNAVVIKSVRPSGIEVSVVTGRLEKEDVDVVVNSLSVSMSTNHGLIATALSRKAGVQLQMSIDEFPGPAKYGDVFKTAGFKLKARSVYHVVICGFNYPNAGDIMERLVLRCLELADKDKHTSISIPALGTGRHAFPPFVVAHRLMEAVRQYESQAGKNPVVKTVRFVLFDRCCLGAFQSILNEIPNASQKELVDKIKSFQYPTGSLLPSQYGSVDIYSDKEESGQISWSSLPEPSKACTVKRPNRLQTKLVNALGVNKTFKKEQLINQLRMMYRELPLPTSFLPWPSIITSKGTSLRSSDMDVLFETILGPEVYRKRNLVLIHGPTYVGKSSLVNQIARMWADGEFKHIKLVIMINLRILLSACSSSMPSLREYMLNCFSAAHIDRDGSNRLFEFSSGRMLLLIDDAEAWCDHFRDELTIDPLFAKVQVIVTSRTSSAVHLAATYHPKLTVELSGFGTEPIQGFLSRKDPCYSLDLADTMSYIVRNTTSVNLTQVQMWLEHCYEVVTQGGLDVASPKDILQRQIWLVHSYLERNMSVDWMTQFSEVQFDLGKAFFFYYIKKKDPQWNRFAQLDILNIRPTPRLVIDYCIAIYIVKHAVKFFDKNGTPPRDLSSMESVYMLQTSFEMACGHSLLAARTIHQLISYLADNDCAVRSARERALDDDGHSARVLKRVNDLQVGCLRQSSMNQEHTDVPDELQYLGDEYVRVYLLACEQGTKAVRRTRVMIVGHFGAGKTSLKRRLVNEAFDPHYILTNGIEVDPAECSICMENTSCKWNVIKKALEDEHSSEVARVVYGFIKKLKRTGLPGYEEVEVTTPEVGPSPIINFECYASFSSEHSPVDFIDSPMETEPELEPEPEPEPKPNYDTQRSTVESTGSLSSGPLVMRSKSTNALVSAMGECGLSDAEMNVMNALPKVIIRELKKLMNKDTGTLTRQSSNEVKFSFWDFAGQHVFYTTHQTFLSHRAIYLLVMDLTRPLNCPIESQRLSRHGLVVDHACPQTVGEYLDYWLNSIHTHAVMNDTQSGDLTQPPVIIVCTHKDKLEQIHGKEIADQMVTEYFDLINKHLDKKAYHDHVSINFFAVSNSIDHDPSLTSLQEELVRVAEVQPYWGEQIPLKWLALRARLHTLQNNQGSVTTRQQVNELAEEAGISCSTEVITFLLFYHALGELVFFNEEPLRELVILDPLWLIENFRKVITIQQFHKQLTFPNSHKHWANLDDYGVLHDIILEHVWDPPNKEQLVSIMHKFNLILPINSDYRPNDTFSVPIVSGQETKLYLVPCMLPQAALEDIHPPGKYDPSPLLFIFKEGFIPLGVFHRLLAMCINQMQWECFGAIYHDFASFLVWPEEMVDVTISLQVHTDYIEVTARSLCDEEDMNPDCMKRLPDALSMLSEQLQGAVRTVSPTLNFYVGARCTCKVHTTDKGSIVNLDRIRSQLATKKNIRCLVHKATFKAESIQPWFPKQIIPEIIQTSTKPVPVKGDVLTEERLLNLAKELGEEWQMLGIYLGLTNANIEHCKLDHHKTILSINNMFNMWREQQSSTSIGQCIDHLINGLKNISRWDLAETVYTWKMIGVNLKLDDTLSSENKKCTRRSSIIERIMK